MAFSKVKTESIADSGVTTAKIANDAVVASKVDDDGTGFTVGNLTNSGTLQQTGQVTLGTGSGSGGNWTLPTARGANDKYVLQINATSGAANWVESLVAPEVSSHNYDVSGSTDDGGINAYEAPYAVTGTTTNASTTISAITTTNIKAGQYISGAGIPANTTVSSISSAGSSNNGTIVISNQATAAASGVALKIQKTPGEKNGGKVILTGTNFGTNIADISVAITNSGGSVIANASYLTGLSGGTTITAEWTGTEGTYSTDLTSSYTGKIYFKITKSGLASNVYDSNTTLTTDGTLTELSTSSQTGGERSATPSATSLGTYGSGQVEGGGQDSNTKLLLNFDRISGTDIEDSSNTDGDGHKVTASGHAVIKASPFGDGKAAIRFDGSNDKITIPTNAGFQFGSTNSFTVEFWVQPTGAISSAEVICSLNNTGSTDSDFYCRFESGKINWYNNADHASPSTSDFVVGKWYHVAFVRKSGTMYCYKDGKLLYSFSDSYNYDGGGEWGIGARKSGGSWTQYAEMYLDEFRIVKGTDATDGAIYTGNFTVPTSRLSTTWAANPFGGSNTVANSTAANTKLLIHSNVNTEIPTTFNSNNSIISSTSGDLGGAWSQASVVNANVTTVAGDTFEGVKTVRLQTGSTGGFSWTTRKVTIPNYSASKRYSVSAKLFSCQKSDGTTEQAIVGLWVGDSTDSPGTTVQTSESNIPDAIYELGSGNVATGATLSSGVFTNKGADIYITFSSNQNVNFYIEVGDILVNEWDDSSDSNHTLTPTGGAAQSLSHGGIAPALAWTTSGKLTGSAGIYFDGDTSHGGDRITVSPAPTHMTTQGANTTVEFWFYCTGIGHRMSFFRTPVYDKAGIGCNFLFEIEADGDLKGWFLENQGYTYSSGSDQSIYYVQNFTTTFPNNQWHHFAFTHVGWGGGNITVNTHGVANVFCDGKYLAPTPDTRGFWRNKLIDATEDNLCFGGGPTGSATDIGSFKGYMDGIRVSDSIRYTGIATSEWGNYDQPTKAYGAFGSEKPDVGTITLTATGSGDYTWSELAAGTALPGTLAVGSTAHSGSGNSRTHTATITGAFTSGVSSDTTTSGILLKAQNDADATKAITLGSSGGYDGIGITQKSTGNPALFSGRRYMGNATARDINGLGFQADLVWFKQRDTSGKSHQLIDSVRGGNKIIYPDANSGTSTRSANAGYITSFNNDGFSLDSDSSGNGINTDNQPLISYAWKAGGAPSGTLGTINSSNPSGAGTITNVGGATSITQSVNQNSGLSITAFNGSASGCTVPHNLGGTPAFILICSIDTSQNWACWHKNLAATAGYRILLDTDAAQLQQDASGKYFPTAPNGTDITCGSDDGQGGSTDPFIMYAWKSVAGVSAFGTHTGQISSVSGTTVGANGYCGFKPRWLMIKCISHAGSWAIFDSFRGEAAAGQMYYFESQGDGAESSDTNFTAALTSNGFTTGTHNSVGGSGRTYITIAFA